MKVLRVLRGIYVGGGPEGAGAKFPIEDYGGM